MTVKEYNRSVDEYSDLVYRFIRGNLKDEDRSNDVVQDAYEKLWRHVTEIDYVVVKAWLFSTAYHNMDSEGAISKAPFALPSPKRQPPTPPVIFFFPVATVYLCRA